MRLNVLFWQFLKFSSIHFVGRGMGWWLLMLLINYTFNINLYKVILSLGFYMYNVTYTYK